MEFINIYDLFSIPFRLDLLYPTLLLSLPAIIFGYIYFKTKKIFIGITALYWLLYVLYEGLLMPLSECPEPCNPIRVDLVLFFPQLFICTIISAAMYLQKVLPHLRSLPRSTKVLLIVTAVAFLAIGFIFGYYVREIHDDYNFDYKEKIPQVDNKRDPNAPPAEKGLELEPNSNYLDSKEKSE